MWRCMHKAVLAEHGVAVECRGGCSGIPARGERVALAVVVVDARAVDGAVGKCLIHDDLNLGYGAQKRYCAELLHVLVEKVRDVGLLNAPHGYCPRGHVEIVVGEHDRGIVTLGAIGIDHEFIVGRCASGERCCILEHGLRHDALELVAAAILADGPI